MKKISLFVIDFDGTALGGYEPYARFPDSLSDFLDNLSREGILWATCTTWHPFGQEEVFRASKLKSRPVRAIGRTSLNCGVYLDGKLYLDAEWDEEMLSRKADYDKNYAQPVREFLKRGPEIASFTEYFDYIFPFDCRADRRTTAAALAADELIREKTYAVFLSERNAGLIFPYYMSKGLAVSKIQKQLGVSAECTMVAGDGVNDLPMFDKGVASYQVCPANADVQIKEIVKQNGGVVGTLSYSDGIVEAAGKLLRQDNDDKAAEHRAR